MQDTRAAFTCYAIENAVNIVVALALYKRLGVDGLALSYSVAYGIGVVIALIMLRARLGSIGGRPLVESTVRSTALSLLMAVAVAAVAAVTGRDAGIVGWCELLLAILVGLGVYVVGAGAAGTLAARKPRRGSVAEGEARGSRDRHGLGERPSFGPRPLPRHTYRPPRGAPRGPFRR
jgi:peptidoglycan biosynthesis protein MviN/MurJ (putative lipid II flippase)